MTGWRIGYIGAPLWIAKACIKLQGQFTSGVCSIAQRAALAAIQGNGESQKDNESCLFASSRPDMQFTGGCKRNKSEYSPGSFLCDA